jgi:ATP-dependent Lhr-like helicase
VTTADSALALLPAPFVRWFSEKGWQPRDHQLELLARARSGQDGGESLLLIAPTGAGKTLAGFLPSLTELTERGRKKPGEAFTGIHTLYISPLKALAVDIARNLETPVTEMGLPIRIETRTGDTPVSRRQRQRRYPPDILLTTPEQVALLLSHSDSERFCSRTSLSASCLTSYIRAGYLEARRSALAWSGAAEETCAQACAPSASRPRSPSPWNLRALPGAAAGRGRGRGRLITSSRWGATPTSDAATPRSGMPWSGHSARHALPEVYELIKRNKTTLVFVNTRSQAEMLFQDLWRMNDDGLAIALHHGSLDVAQRRKVEDAMAAGKLRGVVCTSSLDLGVDWGDVDLVINIGAPKGSSRLMQRIGRANHRFDEASRAVLVPANRFEVLECRVAHRCHRRECAGYAAVALWRARRAGPARAGLRLRQAVPVG